MTGDWKRWVWTSVTRVHRQSACTGRVYQYAYWLYPPAAGSYERCIGLWWCSNCREHASNLIAVARERVLWDALAGLPDHERDRIGDGTTKLRDYLDRLARRGEWPLT